ncbi:MAG: hypothetical protein KTR15_08195 [Phycisphaeraceae bacterium]|nr:hypothetical protein [Phycisphaeraceae bacterium]
MIRTLITLLALLLAAPAAFAEVTLPSVFGDHMVLQRDKEVRIWGKAEPGEMVTVQCSPGPGNTVGDPFVDKKSTKADPNGNWEVRLTSHGAGGGSWLLKISGSKTPKPIQIKDVLFGEVWVASGQSNMSWTVANSNNAKEEIANSANDQIRMWTAERTVKTEPAFDVKGSWAVASPKTTGNFSAVAYFYARKLQEELDVPIGILHSSWGGTPIEAWTSRGKLDTIDWAKPILKRYDAAVKAFPKAKAEHDKAMKRWLDTRNGPRNSGEKAGYAKPGFDDSKWKAMELPQQWEKAGLPNKDGVVWFRKTVDVPQGWAGQQLKLSLGPIDDGDTTYVNAAKVGEMVAYAGNWNKPRNYTVPAKLVKEGRLTIAVRVIDLAGDGGIWGKPDELTLSRADAQGEPLSLAGEWKYLLAQELNAKNRPTRQPATPYGPEHPHSPAGLFNGMLAPIVPYTIRGAIWYQGEHNAPRAQQYGKLFPGMIEDWRKRWGQGDFPFLFVQLANYRQPTDKVVDTDWAHMRDAQLKTLRDVKNTGMAVTIDIGEANDIHPRNKQDVGKRLARWALADTYDKKDVVKSGPSLPLDDRPYRLDVFGNKKPKHKQIGILFETFGSKLAIRGNEKELQGFAIAGKDKRFFHAQAVIDGDSTVWVWSDKVKDPVFIRYAWEDNPDEANLVNQEGLPASPFRTDSFKGPTDGRW